MFLKKIKVKNLCERGLVEIDFKNKVTILTGINGTGKSSILNVIYDTLSVNTSGFVLTSKNRMWTSHCELENNVVIQSILLAPLPESKRDTINELVSKYINGNGEKSLLSDSFSNELNAIYQETPYKTHVVFSQKNSSSSGGRISGFNFPKALSQEKRNEIFDDLTKRSNAFLFQEDRKIMHDISKSNIDATLPFWSTYSSSIDQRFFYIRDAMQIRESIIDAERSKIIDELNFNSITDVEALSKNENYSMLQQQKKEILKIYDLLNTYFNDSGKVIAKDQDDHKITLRQKDSKETLSWHLLSRGEKTLIYLFFMVFLYKDKVRVYLLDEPEIALHVKWQENLIRDLTNLSPDSQFIITTHSPHLVMNGWLKNCLTVNLFKGN